MLELVSEAGSLDHYVKKRQKIYKLINFISDSVSAQILGIICQKFTTKRKPLSLLYIFTKFYAYRSVHERQRILLIWWTTTHYIQVEI